MTEMTISNQLSPQDPPSYPKTLNGQQFKKYISAALAWLKANQQTVNSLNVFPVPDGDTGTNMVLTMQAAYNEIANSNELNVGKMSKDLAQGALMGARGNSGVILSQILRGFARSMDNLPEMDSKAFVNALAESRNTAYKGVVRPVEGTILTVIKDIAAEADNSFNNGATFEKLLEDVVKAADVSVRNTPDLLPILKTAGVVDSGGKGLFFLFEGVLRSIQGASLEAATAMVQPLNAINIGQAMEEIEEGQDVEVVIDFKPFKELDLQSFYQDLSTMGTSIQVGEGDGMYRMHIHVEEEKQNLPHEYISKIGLWTREARENLCAQMPSYSLAEVKPGQIAVVVVSPGDGISRIFASLGAAGIIEGGQTMNPSTEQILKAFENLPTDNVVILPNNKNIILAANTAKSLSVKHVSVIPSKNVPQGLAAILRINPDGDFDKIVEEMNEALSEVECAEITIATRSVELNGVEVEEGKVIGLLDGQLVVSSPTVEETCMQVLEKAETQVHERITLLYGNNISKDEVDNIVGMIQETYPNLEIEVHSGGQPHYQFIISIE
jgi:DAK2 domain fusion protein YloV